jgi:tRNA (guanine37-N1)-methyltransferase
VPRTSAELALKLLSEMKLLDRDFNLRTDAGSISLPVIRPPKWMELDTLKRKIPQIISEDSEFEPRMSSPHSLEESLIGKVPSEVLTELPRSFDIVGDIAVLEFASEVIAFEQQIAGAILEVHPNVKAVFAKTGPITGTERIRPLRHVAGEDRTETVHREFGCSFKVDLAHVFFSPRLSTEHQRVARQVAEGERVVDMFAGVGPFSILIAKTVKDVKVDAIDSNPIAAKLIEENAGTNRVESKIHVHAGDAKDVVRQLGHSTTRVIMNHPSAARDFVDAACTALALSGGIIHYYTFAKGEDSELKARTELSEALKASEWEIGKILGVRKAREVAPMNWQVVVDAEVSQVSK